MNANWRYAAVAALALASGCGAAQSGLLSSPQGANNPGSVTPKVLQTGTKPINWTQFPTPATGFGVSLSVAAGPDGNMYFGNNQGGLMQVKMTGADKLIPLTYHCNGTTLCNFQIGYAMTLGSDNRLYVGGTDYNYATSRYEIGAATTAGVLTVHDIPSGDYNGSGGIAVGPDNNIWFTEQKHIGRITTTGTITEFSYPSGATSNSYGGVTAGPDGNVWFSEYNNQIVAKIVPSTGHITEYSVASLGCYPTSILAGSDGKMYFSCSNYLGQISTSGSPMTRFYDAYGISYFPNALRTGGDGNIWFPSANGDYVGEFNPVNVSFTTYVPPFTAGTIYDMARGPDGNFWAPENDNKIDVYIVNTLTVTPTSLSFTATGQKANLTVKEPGTTKWTATSVSPGVCSVAQGTSNSIFVVTANGVGSTKITVQDAIGNLFYIPCKVT